MKINTDKLLTAEQLIEDLFPVNCRPSMRTFKRWQARRIIPYYKIGQRVYFDPVAVREKLEKKNIVHAI